MQCAHPMKKRSLEAEPRNSKAKRLCLEAELQMSDCPMETSQSSPATNQQPDHQVRPTPVLLCCPRCLRGEPGHFNHIMGL
ncbi:uncharacterized protein si:ch211-221j21.3 [Neolamprologus brichardi]|uniref:uncharacterized protein si:ch211-221j21.3 n=1 Tax=Neolamprologus brichardi TaxID=32507 RepID=UPI001643ED25|nr:uncharacterized protein si:ch211-221j21.3 [Neolamprologus brichardi]